MCLCVLVSTEYPLNSSLDLDRMRRDQVSIINMGDLDGIASHPYFMVSTMIIAIK